MYHLQWHGSLKNQMDLVVDWNGKSSEKKPHGYRLGEADV